jgi:hypothetical protein
MALLAWEVPDDCHSSRPLFPPPAFAERSHSSFARRLVAVGSCCPKASVHSEPTGTATARIIRRSKSPVDFYVAVMQSTV